MTCHRRSHEKKYQEEKCQNNFLATIFGDAGLSTDNVDIYHDSFMKIESFYGIEHFLDLL